MKTAPTTRPKVTCPPRKPVTDEQIATVNDALGTYLQACWDEGGAERKVMERIIEEARQAENLAA